MTDKAFEQSIEKILCGDKSGLKEIYDAYLSYIYQIIYGILGRKEDAEDVTSDFFIKLWQNADKYKSGNGHKGYMATMARNMAIDHMRKYKREILDDFDAKDEDDAPKAEPVSEQNTEGEVIEEISVREALAKLKPEEAQIVNMKVLADMTFAEISETLSVPMGTVTWRYREAIKKLRRYGYYETA